MPTAVECAALELNRVAYEKIMIFLIKNYTGKWTSFGNGKCLGVWASRNETLNTAEKYCGFWKNGKSA